MSDREKIIGLLQETAEYFRECRSNASLASKAENHFWELQNAANEAVELIKAQEPKRPVHIHQEYEEHDWKRDEDGKIDRFAFEYDLCAGPYCERCGFSFCEYCWPDGWKQPCVIDKDVCPSCKKQVWKPMKFCSDCGQELNWE